MAQLEYSYRDANLQIDKLLMKSEKEVSPLLQVYDDLAKHSNFRMPLKSLLEFDTRVFLRHLRKMKKAHEVELRWVRKAARDRALELLKQDYQRTQEVISAELSGVVAQFNDLKVTLFERE